ncbi:MAG: TonB-dependent receptor [Gammaproteobacteria bacterium]|nr:TonB-dependent receptor [Gammaproteobacteria bacterium]
MAQQELEEVVVTGSLITRRDFEANSPIVTVDEDLFDQSATSAVETQLNRLPQFTPTLDNPTQGGDIQPNARNTPGSATVSLRGLGANRSLVLINGRRGTPANALGVMDINTIPPAAIERVEAISGGASATYGADAVAGAVNFIMRNDFQGLELDVQTGSPEEGDNFEYQASAVMGTDFADGEGNVSLAVSTNKRNEALQRDRDWYQELWADPSIGGTQFFPEFTGFFTGFDNLPDPAALNAVIDGASFAAPPANAAIYSDFNGNAFSGFDAAGVPGTSGAEFLDGQKFVALNNGQIDVNNTDNYLILPLTRYNMYSQGNYRISDAIGAFAEGYFSRTSTDTIQEPVPITSGWSVPIDPTINRDVIPQEFLTILDSRPDPNAPFALRALLPFNRTSSTDVSTYSLTVGLEGELPAGDWTWEVFTSQGEAETTVLQQGFASLQRMRAVMQQPNFGQGFELMSNAGPPDFGFGGATATCETGLNPFAWDSVSQDCFDAINADISTKQVMDQSIWQVNFQGGLAELPGGQARAAVGFNYRENDYRFQNDTLVTQGGSFLEQAAGLYPAGSSAGIIDVSEAYVEFLVPVLSDLPAVQQLDFEIGARYSDYSTTGGSNTYKMLADWRINDGLRIRGGFNRAERAPNVAELFLAPEQTFAIAAGGDICSINNSQAWSANPEQNPENWDDVVRLCGALMEATGNPTADDQFYGVAAETVASADPAAVAAGTVTTTPQGAGPSFLFPTTIGNPTLDTEEADTWTLGAVIDLALERQIFSDMRISIDYYDIEVSSAIGEQSPDIVMRQCADPAFNPDFDINSPFCAGFNRNATGNIGDIRRTFFNNGRFRTSGVDLQLNWSFDAGPGRVNITSLVNTLIELESAELPTDPLTDFAGTFGPTENGLNGNAYDYRTLSTFNYSLDRVDLSLRWQHLPSIDAEIAADDPNTTITGASAYNLFDLLGRFQLGESIGLRFGIENVFNEEPPLTGRDPAAQLPALPGGSFNTNNYDINGRRYYFGATVDF